MVRLILNSELEGIWESVVDCHRALSEHLYEGMGKTVKALRIVGRDANYRLGSAANAGH
jgi:hypothetical protein